MELRVGEALLRSSQPLLPFLAPAAFRCSAPRRLQQCLRQHHPSRTLTTSSRKLSQNEEISDLLDQTVDKNKSRLGTARAQQTQRTTANPSARMASERARGDSSLRDLLADFRPRRSHLSEIADTLDTGEALDPNRNDSPPPPPPLPTPPVKLNSSVGRTILVAENRGMDVGRAFRTLEMRCAQNAVKKDHMRQRFHERPGLKRKRLKSERWRKRFKEGFQHTIKLVQGLKKQGW